MVGAACRFGGRLIRRACLFAGVSLVAELAGAPGRLWRGLATTCVVCTILVVVPRDWQRQDEPDRDFYQLLKRLKGSPSGTRVELPIRPGNYRILTR